MDIPDIEELIAAADRRDHLCRSVPVCPDCRSEQVQLVGHRMPATWRCRRCRQWFRFEPAA